MASSLLLPSRESLAGQWQLSVNDGSAQICVLELCVQAPTLAGDLQCAARLLGQQPGSWEPTPDGLWLFDQEGNGLVHLNRQGTRYTASGKRGELTFSRDVRD